MAGTYPLTITLLDGDCIAQDASLPPTSFLTWIGANAQAGMLDIEQDGSDLLFAFEACTLGGTIDVAGGYYAGGECESPEGASLVVTGTGTALESTSDASRIDIEGQIHIDVDYSGDGSDGADGETDCYREVRIGGTSF